MRALLLITFLAWLSMAATAQPPLKQEQKMFPYPYTIDDLPNGLRLVTVQTDYPNLVALYIVVNTGSRNEVESGKSGYAHLFEHVMFRGSQNYTPEKRDAILKLAGASSNAYTSDDRTVYHEVFAREDLDEILKMEADRFLQLKYSPDVYRTETQAVLGEYNKNSANPFSKLHEKLRETAFDKHTYKHTTMGFLKDIEDMPNQFNYSQEFYRRYYRPENTTIVLAGDVTREQALGIVKRHFGDWKRGDFAPSIPVEPEQKAPRTAHVEWPSPTLPHIAIAFRGPAYSDEKKDKAALDLLAAIAFGENSDLYRRLALKEQKVDLLEVSFDNQVDPELFTVFARIKDPKDVDYARDQILDAFKRYTKELVPQQKLDETRSRLRYSMALAMNSSEAIASALAPFIALRRTPETINQLFALYQRITPEDIRAAASKYFVDDHRTIVTLSSEVQGAGDAQQGGQN
ncbi:MAG TPA: pitrilysin family protein [Blastocatellia bacterium]|nr:pitrilysin family protein [Blastocatellia bacterium]